MCSNTIPVIYTDKRKLFWPFPSVYNESTWLECVRVVHQPYEILQLAWDYKMGNRAEAKSRQAACEKMRQHVCDRNARALMYQKDLEQLVGRRA